MNSDTPYNVLSSKTMFNGFFKIQKILIEHTSLVNGNSYIKEWELFNRGNGISVIPYDPVRDKIVLLSQFRIGAYEQQTGLLNEIVSGIVESGESEVDAAYRETFEEIGCQATKMQKIFQYFVSPGGSSEKITLFCGLIDSSRIKSTKFNAEEGEEIYARAYHFDQAYALITKNPNIPSNTIIALQWIALNKKNILNQWKIKNT